MFQPVLRGSDLILARLPNDADVLATHRAHVGALAVEPTFLSEVARAVVATTDREFVRLRERASGQDARFFWGSRRGESLLMRRGPHGDQVVVPPGTGHR